MAFNAEWELELLAKVRGLALPDLLNGFGLELAALVRTCEVYRLEVTASGNTFRLLDAQGAQAQPPSEAGLYVIFSATQFLYCGEATTNLRRRQLDDPDNTADSTKRFSNQGRAVLKLVLHRGWAGRLGLDPVFMQLFAASAKLQDGETFECRYHVSRFSKALEAASPLFVHGLHQEMVGRARALGHAGV